MLLLWCLTTLPQVCTVRRIPGPPRQGEIREAAWRVSHRGLEVASGEVGKEVAAFSGRDGQRVWPDSKER